MMNIKERATKKIQKQAPSAAAVKAPPVQNVPAHPGEIVYNELESVCQEDWGDKEDQENDFDLLIPPLPDMYTSQSFARILLSTSVGTKLITVPQ